MVCFRARRLVAGLFICAVALVACKKDEAKPGGSSGGGSPAGNKDLALIPADSDVVLGLDLAAAQKSALFRDLALPQLTKSGDISQVLETLKAKCNIDPLAAATKLTAGFKLAGRNPDSVAVLHGLEKSKVLPCLDQVKEQLAAQQLEAVKDGDVVVIKGERGAIGFTFISDTTAVIVGGSKANKEGVLAAAQAKSTLPDSKEFASMYGRLNMADTAWFLVRGDTEMIAKNLERLNVRTKALFGTVNVTDGVEAHMFVRAETEEQATKLRELMESQAGMAKSMMEKLEIEQEKADVKSTMKLTQQQLKSLVRFAQSFGGAFR